MCNLDGLGGEEAEFVAVRWQPISDVVASMWEKKRAPYEALQRWAEPIVTQWRADAVSRLDLSGTWSRDASRNYKLEEALAVRGLGSEAAHAEATRPYVQSWMRMPAPKPSGVWQVTTYAEDGETVKRSIEYALGEWEQNFVGAAVLFGQGPGKLRRRTAWLPLPHEGTAEASTSPSIMTAAAVRVGHTTWTTRSDVDSGALEITQRHLQDGCTLIVRRTYRSSSNRSAALSTSEEVFVRLNRTN